MKSFHLVIDSLTHYITDTISVSSEPSEGSEEGDTDTDVEDVKVLEPPKKRAKSMIHSSSNYART